MTALKHLHYKDFSLKATGCKKELKEGGRGKQDPKLPISGLICYSTFPCEVSNVWAECRYQSCLLGGLLCL